MLLFVSYGETTGSAESNIVVLSWRLLFFFYIFLLKKLGKSAYTYICTLNEITKIYITYKYIYEKMFNKIKKYVCVQK